MTFASAEEVEAVRGIWGTVVARDFEAARDWATKRLREDLVKPDTGSDPDAYLYRANAVPLGLMGANRFAMAESIYDALISEVDSFNKSHQTRKHRGALLANQAVCQILAGRFDSGVPRLVFTIEQEDWETFGPPESVTPAMSHLDNLVEAPAQRMLGLWAEGLLLQATGQKSDSDDFRQVTMSMGNARWSLYTTVLRAQETWKTHRAYPSVYAPPRLLDGIRGMTVALEHYTKTLGRNSSDTSVRSTFAQAKRLTLYACYKGLFETIGPPWWDKLTNARSSKLTEFDSHNGYEDFKNKSGELLSWPVSDVDSLTAKCLALSLLARNYAAHEAEPPDEFLEEKEGRVPFVDVLRHCSAALWCTYTAAATSGQITEPPADAQ